MRVAIYARYSSDQQRDASIADQFRECRAYVARQAGWVVAEEFHDAAISGATVHRAGFQRLRGAALEGRFDVVLAESLDRFSRDQEDTAALFKRLSFVGVQIVTLAEGEIGHLAVGFKGTMNALYLKDLADKTRRGLRGRVEAGKSGGGLCFGFRVPDNGKGERQIDPAEAAIILRIFQEYVGDASSQTIAKRLNAEGVRGPGGHLWGPSTIHGHAKRGTGILNNELYVGRLVWNRLRYVKDPDTGRRVSRLNPKAQWVVTEVPELRIVPDELWQAAKRRQESVRLLVTAGGNKCHARRPLHLFSGLLKCGACGSGYVTAGATRLACSGRRERGICSNALTIRRDEVERRVLNSLQKSFFAGTDFEAFCEEFRLAANEARMEGRSTLAMAQRELELVRGEIQKVIEAVKKGWADDELRAEMDGLQARKSTLLSTIAARRPCRRSCTPTWPTLGGKRLRPCGTPWWMNPASQRSPGKRCETW